MPAAAPAGSPPSGWNWCRGVGSTRSTPPGRWSTTLARRWTAGQPPDARAFASAVCLVRQLDPLPLELRESFVERVLGRLDEPLVLDYVRLNMTARRG